LRHFDTRITAIRVIRVDAMALPGRVVAEAHIRHRICRAHQIRRAAGRARSDQLLIERVARRATAARARRRRAPAAQARSPKAPELPGEPLTVIADLDTVRLTIVS
jgi:hypothetical protein